MKPAIERLRRFAQRHAVFAVGFGLLFTFARWPPLTGWDEGFYVAELTSAVADRDLLLQDDLLRLANPLDQKLRMLTTIADDGALLNTFSIGPAVLHASYAWPLLVGRQRPVTFALRAALALGSMAFLIVTVLATAALAERLGFARGIARIAAVAAVAFGPLALYGTRAAVNSHLPSAMLAALFCLAVVAWLDSGAPRHALAAGLLAGLLIITRWQELIFVLALAPAVLVALGHRPPTQDRRLPGIAFATVACVGVVALQLVAWRIQFGVWLLVPQGHGYMRWTEPALAPLLLSTFNGLLPWLPGFALGLVGLAWLRPQPASRERRLFALGLMAVVVASLYLSACPLDWWGGKSYGPRRLAALTPVVALGLAQLLTAVRRFRARWIVLGALAGWAVFTLTAVLSGFDDLSIVFAGVTSHWSPLTIDAYSAARWIDHWPTVPRVLRPGFTLSDAPRMLDRVVGLIATLAVLLLVTAAWRALRRSVVVQRVVLGATVAWVAVALVWLTTLPANAPWNSAWRAVVRDAAACATPSALPPRLEDARHLLCAARSARAGDEAATRDHLALVRQAQEYGVSADALRAAQGVTTTAP